MADTINLSITEYAQMFNLSSHTVRHQVTEGVLHAEKLGKRWMIQIDETEVPVNNESDPPNDLINRMELHISDLQSTIEDLRSDYKNKEEQLLSQIEDNKDQLLRQENRIDELIKQNDQSQHIIGQMEKDRQKLIESYRSPFTRLLGFLGVGSGIKST